MGKTAISINPIFPAEHPGPFTLPIFSGTISADAATGITRSGGSLEFLQLGGGQVFWHELWFDLAGHQVLAEVDLEPTPAFPGKLGQMPIAVLGTGTVSADPNARTITVSGARFALNVASATYFNEAFAKPLGKEDVFVAGEPLGTISFVAQAQ
jgi:hypothetical protein